MKTLKNISLFFVLTLTIASCKNENQPKHKTVDVAIINKDLSSTLDPNATYAKVEFNIDGMTCAIGCAKTIEKKMATMEGVKTAKVDFNKRLAMVEYDEAKVTPQSLKETVTNIATIYKVKGMKKVDAFGNIKTCKKDCNKTCCEKKK